MCRVCGSAAGLDSPGLYRSVSGGGLDTRQLADTGEQLLLLLSDILSGTWKTEACLFSDLEQLEVSSLCDWVVRFLQDLPGPVLPSSLQADMVRAVQGQVKAGSRRQLGR